MAPYNITLETVEWTWTIRDAEVNKKIDGRTDVVATILWSLQGEFFGPKTRPGYSEQYMEQVSGRTILAPPSEDNFSDISTVKKSVLRRWLLGTLSEFEQNEIKQKVLKKLDKTCNSDTYWLG